MYKIECVYRTYPLHEEKSFTFVNFPAAPASTARPTRRRLEPTLASGAPWGRAAGRLNRAVQAAAFSPGTIGDAQGRAASSQLRGWPSTMRVITAPRSARGSTPFSSQGSTRQAIATQRRLSRSEPAKRVFSRVRARRRPRRPPSRGRDAVPLVDVG